MLVNLSLPDLKVLHASLHARLRVLAQMNHLVYSGGELRNAVGRVRVSGRNVEPSNIKDLNDAEVKDRFDLSEQELYECKYYNQQRIDRRKMGLE